jgi:ubiquinol-cytochrome c reductase cytochrome b subunit
VIATQFHVGFESEVRLLRLALAAGPVTAFWLTRRICLGLQAMEQEQIAQGVETGVVMRTLEGGYEEAHKPLSPARRWALAAAHPRAAVPMRRPRPGAQRTDK